MRPIDQLGVGVVYVPGLEPLLEPSAGLVDVIEIEPQTFWHYHPTARPRYWFPAPALEKLHHYPQPKIVHGVGRPVGGNRPINPEFQLAFVQSIEQLGALWASEHLGFNNFSGNEGDIHTGFILPLLQTELGARTAVTDVCRLSEELAVPFAIETPTNYLKPRANELNDGEFIAVIAEESNCGILLDLHNIWANERNGRMRVDSFLRTIPLDRVCEVHLAGGFEREGYWLDAHSGAIPAEVLAIAREIIPDLPYVKAVIFEILGPFVQLAGTSETASQLEVLKDVWESRRAVPANRCSEEVKYIFPVDTKHSEDETREWEKVLGSLVTCKPIDGRFALDLVQDPAILLFRSLIRTFRAGMIVDVLPLTVRLIMLAKNTEYLEALLDEFFANVPPEQFASAEAVLVARFLHSKYLDVPYLSEVLAYEEASLKATLENVIVKVPFSHDPAPILESLVARRLPPILRQFCCEIDVGPEEIG